MEHTNGLEHLDVSLADYSLIPMSKKASKSQPLANATIFTQYFASQDRKVSIVGTNNKGKISIQSLSLHYAKLSQK